MTLQDSHCNSAEILVAEALAEEIVDASHDLPVNPDSLHSVSAAWICRSCACKASLFFCADCVTNGNFTRSRASYGSQRFADRRLELLQVNQRRLHLSNDFLVVSETTKKSESLVRSIDRKKWIVQRLFQNLHFLRLENTKLTGNIFADQRQVDEENSRSEKRQQKCTETKKRLIKDHAILAAKKREALLKDICIAKQRKSAVRHLVRDIFPLVELDAQLIPVRASTETAAEYCRILEPILPCNGNYSAYYNYSCQTGEIPSDVNIRNPLYEVPAGLGMVAQLLHILIQILSYPMPDLVEFGLFLGPGMDESSFQKAVYQLNWNILTLCSSQGIRVEDLPLKETVGNLLKLIRWTQLGSNGPYDLSNILVFTEDEPSPTSDFQHGRDGYGTEGESDGADETDWENIPVASSSILPALYPNEQLSRSTFGSAVNAVSSLFRSTTEMEFKRQK